MAALWTGIVEDKPVQAMPAFFPEAAYAQIKAVADPAADFKARLVSAYKKDIAAAHEVLGADAPDAKFVGVSVPHQWNWVAPGDCYNTGGYWQWMLYPRYRIWMDMEVPFLFTDDDFYLTNEAFHEATALRAVLKTYHPDFVAAPANRQRFPDLIKAVPDYVPVFFDDEDVLYASAARHPALVERYALHQLQPFTALHQSAEQTLKDATDPAALRAELERMLAMDPDGLLTNELVARLLLRAGDVERARPLAETLIRRFPDVATGYQLRGEVLQAQGHAAAAIAAYEQALQWCDGDVCRTVARQQAGLYLERRQPQPAYQLLRALAPLFEATSSRDDLYHLAVAARLTGRRQEAARILRYLAVYRVAPDDADWQLKIRAERACGQNASSSCASPAAAPTIVDHAPP